MSSWCVLFFSSSLFSVFLTSHSTTQDHRNGRASSTRSGPLRVCDVCITFWLPCLCVNCWSNFIQSWSLVEHVLRMSGDPLRTSATRARDLCHSPWMILAPTARLSTNERCESCDCGLFRWWRKRSYVIIWLVVTGDNTVLCNPNLWTNLDAFALVNKQQLIKISKIPPRASWLSLILVSSLMKRY